MSADNRQEAPPGGPWSTEGQQEAVFAAEVLFNAFCLLIAGLGLVGWYRGAVSGTAAITLGVFSLVSIVMSVVSLRTGDSHAIGYLRVGAGLLLAPVTYVLVDGALAPYWPGFVVMLMGVLIMLGLTGQRVLWSRVLILGYIGFMVLVTLLLPPRTELHVSGEPAVNWYQLVMVVGAVAMIGLMSTQSMSLLGTALAGLRERSRELTDARDKLSAELNVAHEIQVLLLPKDPQLPGNTVKGRMVPAKEVGGDYYDVIEIEGQRAFLAVGDVSGHGLTSGLTMMMARTGLLGILEATPDISLVEAYRALNRCLRHNLARMDLDMYMTFVLIESKGQGEFEAVGQHLPLLIYRRRTNEVEEISLEGVWLGLVDEIAPEVLPPVRFRLEVGDLLVLYTDGVVEHFAGREMFGFGRFKQVVCDNAALGPSGLIDATLARLRAFSGEQRDDITMLVVDHRGEVQGTRQGARKLSAPENDGQIEVLAARRGAA